MWRCLSLVTLHGLDWQACQCSDCGELRLGVQCAAKISGLVGRSYALDVAVSRFSFRQDGTTFQVLKFYPEGSSVFAGLKAVSVAAGKSADQACESGLADKELQEAIPDTPADAVQHTPPLAAALVQLPMVVSLEKRGR